MLPGPRGRACHIFIYVSTICTAQVSDVTRWLLILFFIVLGYAASMWALFAGNDAPLNLELCEQYYPLDVTMDSFSNTFLVLFLGTLTGDLTEGAPAKGP